MAAAQSKQQDCDIILCATSSCRMWVKVESLTESVMSAKQPSQEETQICSCIKALLRDNNNQL